MRAIIDWIYTFYPSDDGTIANRYSDLIGLLSNTTFDDENGSENGLPLSHARTPPEKESSKYENANFECLYLQACDYQFGYMTVKKFTGANFLARNWKGAPHFVQAE